VVNYQAYISSHDVFSWRITPAADRAYNSMQIYYTDATNNNNYGSVTSTDSRLTATLTQGNAPFRYRKYLQDFSGTSTIGATQASSIEATQLGIMQNVTNKTQMVLRNVRNASGASIPLWAPQADNCIDVPELAQRQQAIATLPTAGTNLFYILNTEYAEDSSGNQSLTLQCDNWYDYAQTRIARLEAKAYQKTMNGSTTAPVQALGSPEFGNCGFQAYCASAGASFGQFFNYRMMLASAPTSITLTSGVTTNANSVAASSLGTAGFFFGWTAPAIGTTEVTRHYLTVGNTLLAVDLEAGTFDHHCDGCDTTRRGLAIAEHLRIAQPRPEVRPEDYSLSIDCPTCGMIECLNTELPEADEIEHERNSAHRATMVKRIRALQTHKHVQQTLQQALNSGKGVN
jgi:hypothetical protein